MLSNKFRNDANQTYSLCIVLQYSFTGWKVILFGIAEYNILTIISHKNQNLLGTKILQNRLSAWNFARTVKNNEFPGRVIK